VQSGHPDAGIRAMTVGIRIAKPPADRLQIILCLSERHSRVQARDDPQKSVGAVAAADIGGRRVRHDHVEVADER
jgi:hypothetical protein